MAHAAGSIVAALRAYEVNGPRIGLVSCLHIPEPDEDEEHLVSALRNLGLPAEVVAWNDPACVFTDHDLLVLRSCWDYHEPEHRAQFRSWIVQAAASTMLANPLPVIQWNSDKRYLLELAELDVPVAPTMLVPHGGIIDVPDAWSRVVIKPAISAGSRDTYVVDITPGAPLPHVAQELVAREDVLVQEYVRSVDTYGERCLVWIDGTLSHAVRKEPRFSGDSESVSLAGTISAHEAAFANQVLETAALCGGFAVNDLLYARIDLAPDTQGAPMLMELELIEPSLFLHHFPPSLSRFAASIAQRARAGFIPRAHG